MNILNQGIERQGDGPFAVWRIPGIVATAKGTLLLCYECRLSDNDWDTRSVAVRRSTDGGVTWSDRMYIDRHEALAVNNPVLLASRDGIVFFFYHIDMDRLFLRISYDDGITFSSPSDISYAIDAFRPEYSWTVCCVGPGHGIELSNGRLIIPLWLSANPDRIHHPSVCSTIVSDDHGETFKRGDILYDTPEMISPNETSACELPDGSVMLNIRHRGTRKRRAVTVSADGQTAWQPVRLDSSLPDPACYAGLLRVGNLLVFSNCASETGRTDLTVRASGDFGSTWPYAAFLDREAGYSDLAASPDGKKIYCFYERGNLNNAPVSLQFASFSLEDVLTAVDNRPLFNNQNQFL